MLSDFMQDQFAINIEKLDNTFGEEARREIINTFLHHSVGLFTRLEVGFATQNSEEVADVAHQFKGMAASVYASELNARALNLEKLAKEKDPQWSKMQTAFESMKSAYDKVKNQIEARVS